MAEERDSDQISWGTWEELLLACAVKRHGFMDWNSIAMEVQSRSSLSHLLITARDCELKFLDLKRRYQDENDVVLNQIGSRISDKVDIENVPWIDELRNLRVAELRREVQRYDVSIHSLQLKVKKLEQEREHGFKETEIGTEKPDLTTKSRDIRSENDERIFSDSDRSEPKINNTKLAASGEDSDREDLSVNQSNSSGNRKNIAENGKSETKPEFTNSGSFRPGPVGPQSDDGSTETLVKMKKETEVDGESELADSAAEAAATQSNEGGEETRESSEVQSSASLTGKLKMKMKKKKKKKNKRERFLRKEISGGSSGNETRLTETVKSRRLMEVLQMIRTLKHSSLFESRLQSQETEEYKGVVRQHLDLEIVQAKLNSGSYSSSSLAFYRDLLLLCNNAITFFPRFSNESMAAHKLRRLVSSEMKKSQQVVPTDPSPEVVDSSPAVPSQPKGPLERSDSLLAKQKSSAPIIVCRKRSSISAKHSTIGFGDKGDRSNDDEKSVFDLKSTVKMASNAAEELGSTKDSKLNEKPVTGARSWRRSGDSLTNSSGPSVKKQSTSASWKPTSATKTEAPPKADKKKPDMVTPEKKRSAADFLKRIKQNSPAETIKRNGRGGGGSSSGGNAGGEQKNGVSKGKERASRQSNDKKHPKDDSSPSKRSVGRPPKKMPEPNPVSTKRAREGGGKEPLKRPRKRSRR